MSTIKAASIQMKCVEDKKKNLAKAIGLIEMAAERGSELIFLQELFNTTWFPKDADSDNFQLAEREDGEAISELRNIAAKTSTVIAAPFFEEGVEGLYFNSTAVIDENGGLIGIYRKTHIPQIPLYEEGYYFAAGDLGFPVFETKFGKIGVQICWDNFYPEGSRILALKGARIIFAPTAAAFASQERWKTVISANAIVNGVFIFRANRVGNEEKHRFYGESFCVDPTGELLEHPSGTGDGIYEVEIDLSLVQQTRRDFPYLKGRRQEMYGTLAGLELQPEGQESNK